MPTVTWMDGCLMAQKVWRSSDSQQVFWFSCYKLFLVWYPKLLLWWSSVFLCKSKVFANHHDYYLFFNFKMSVTLSESKKVPCVPTTGNKYFEWNVWPSISHSRLNTNRVKRVQNFKMSKNQKLLMNNLNTGVQTMPMFSII